MRATDAYNELRALGRPLVETREVAARLGISLSNASHLLSSTESANLVRRVRRGLWAIDLDVDPVVVAPYLTAPWPAYVSFWSALARHDMIEQIPRPTFVASLMRSKKITTTIGMFSIHHLAPELFDGFEGSADRGYLATPEKALFDSVYVRVPRGARIYFPELSLPSDFDEARLHEWLGRINRPRLKTLVSRELERALAQASPRVVA